MCRNEFDDKEIVPHLKGMHPGVADELEQWPDGGVVNNVFPADMDDDLPSDTGLGS